MARSGSCHTLSIRYSFYQAICLIIRSINSAVQMGFCRLMLVLGLHLGFGSLGCGMHRFFMDV